MTPSTFAFSERESGSVFKFNADGGIGAVDMLSIAAASSPVAAIFHVNNHMIRNRFSRDAFLPLWSPHMVFPGFSRPLRCEFTHSFQIFI